MYVILTLYLYYKAPTAIGLEDLYRALSTPFFFLYLPLIAMHFTAIKLSQLSGDYTSACSLKTGSIYL